MANLIALFYNWWNLYVRFYDGEHHREAIRSRPLLMSGVGRQVQSGGQRTIKVSILHEKGDVVARAIRQISGEIGQIRAITERWAAAPLAGRKVAPRSAAGSLPAPQRVKPQAPAPPCHSPAQVLPKGTKSPFLFRLNSHYSKDAPQPVEPSGSGMERFRLPALSYWKEHTKTGDIRLKFPHHGTFSR